MAPSFDTLSDHDFELDEEEIDFSGKALPCSFPTVSFNADIYGRSSRTI
jgi:hypothetical protein